MNILPFVLEITRIMDAVLDENQSISVFGLLFKVGPSYPAFSVEILL